jgi:hypothetical protein
MAFVAIYAARLGATSFQVSLLTAGPAVVNLLFSLPAGRWMQDKSLVRVTFWSSIWHRLGYLVFILLPLLLAGSVDSNHQMSAPTKLRNPRYRLANFSNRKKIRL